MTRSKTAPKGFKIASAIALSTASWYFLVLRSLPKVGAENHDMHHCTTNGTQISWSKSLLVTSSSCLVIVLSDTHSWLSKIPAHTQFVHNIIVIKRCFSWWDFARLSAPVWYRSTGTKTLIQPIFLHLPNHWSYRLLSWRRRRRLWVEHLRVCSKRSRWKCLSSIRISPKSFNAHFLNCSDLAIPSLSWDLPSPIPFYLSLFSIYAHKRRSCFW